MDKDNVIKKRVGRRAFLDAAASIQPEIITELHGISRDHINSKRTIEALELAVNGYDGPRETNELAPLRKKLAIWAVRHNLKRSDSNWITRYAEATLYYWRRYASDHTDPIPTQFFSPPCLSDEQLGQYEGLISDLEEAISQHASVGMLSHDFNFDSLESCQRMLLRETRDQILAEVTARLDEAEKALEQHDYLSRPSEIRIGFEHFCWLAQNQVLRHAPEQIAFTAQRSVKEVQRALRETRTLIGLQGRSPGRPRIHPLRHP